MSALNFFGKSAEEPFINNQISPDDPDYTFKFLSYYYDKYTNTATFAYQGIDNIIFSEKVKFAKPPQGSRFNIMEKPELDALIDRAIFLAFVLIGTSYYKAHPTARVELDANIDEWQAAFFNKVYQEGLSQFAFENHFTREQLAHFVPTINSGEHFQEEIDYHGSGILSLQSGGKDSLLSATMLMEAGQKFTPWYVSGSDEHTYPDVIDQIDFPSLKASVALRHIDIEHLKQSGGYNGHVPVTYILESLALVQAIINNQNTVLTSIGHEGEEPTAKIGDLLVTHQWSKTWEAETLMAEYIRRYISPALRLGSPLRRYSELKIAELFVEKCWEKYGFYFSSCNVANYKQLTDNKKLHWCGNCAKCANSYLLFCPFLPPKQLQSLFADEDLFAKESLFETFKGLLGVDGVMKPFECIGDIAELRLAYNNRQSGYAALPFSVPSSNFDYQATYPEQDFIADILRF
ncbi:hypothetical protein IJH97_00300 [Candidatus Saccharibacteria bacterium]|nr:hypothetical protein [Candidatus Saccharibacteria bacterium]